MSLVDSEDEFPNDFDGLDLSNVPGLQVLHPPMHSPEGITAPGNRGHNSASPSNTGADIVVPSVVEPERPSPRSSPSDSFDELEVDPYLLAAIDEIETRALQGRQNVNPSAGSVQHTPAGLSGIPSGSGVTPTQPCCGKSLFRGSVCEREGVVPSTTSKVQVSPSKKGKAKASSEDMLQSILEGYENEITCPICCDILSAAFVTNPCGHTTCGDCGYGWVSRNKYSPSCPVCRAELIKSKPLLPNYAVDNIVKHHLHALARAGQPEWQERGFKYVEWKKRLEAWKLQYSKMRVEESARDAARKRRYQPRYSEEYGHDDGPWLPAEDYVVQVHPPSNRRQRRRTRGNP